MTVVVDHYENADLNANRSDKQQDRLPYLELSEQKMDHHRTEGRDKAQNVRITVISESRLQIGLEDVRMDLDSVHLAASAVRNYEIVLHRLSICTDENNTVREYPRIHCSVQYICKRDIFIITRLAGIVYNRTSRLVCRDHVWRYAEVLTILVIHDFSERLVCNAFIRLCRNDPSYRTVRIHRDVAVTGIDYIKKLFVGKFYAFDRIVSDTIRICLPFLAVEQLVYDNDTAVFFSRIDKGLVTLFVNMT